MFEKAGFNACELARKTGMPLPTWRSRIRRAEIELGKKQPPVSERRLPANSITDAQALEAWKVYERNQYKLGQTATALGMKRSKCEKYIEHARLKLGKKVYGTKPKILLLDIETAPNVGYFWQAKTRYINPDWFVSNGYILCWTAKWLGDDKVIFKRWKKGKPVSLLEPIHRLLNEAHIVVHFNGKKFDIPTLNKEFIVHGLMPPAPYKQVDCLQTLWETFRFPANKMDYIAKTLGIGEKVRHAGPQLWIDCMADKEEAWKNMEEYNKHDVYLLEKLYIRFLPWIKSHPNVSAFLGIEACPKCGSEELKRNGMHLAQVLKYERYQCGACHSWFRGTKTVTDRSVKRFAAAL